MPAPALTPAADGPEAKAAADRYLTALPAPQRAALEHLREVILRACPDAVPAVSYRLAAFRYRGKVIAGFDAAKGTIRFTSERPLPDELIERIVRDRMAKVDAGGR